MCKTKTFRCQSSSPNLQNIPRRTEEGKKIIKSFASTKMHTVHFFGGTIIKEEKYNE